MAIDFYLATLGQPTSEPIIRFYGWNPYCISIGCHQYSNLVKLEKLRSDGYDLVKRPTGGRAIFHAEELTYSIIIPRSMIHHRDLYSFIHHTFSSALNSLGFPVVLKTDIDRFPTLSQRPDDFPCFTKSAQTEVQFQGKKVIGSAQKLYKQAILQHGSLLIGNFHQKLPHYLDISESDKSILDAELNLKTTCLNQIKNNKISPEKIMTTIVNELELAYNISVYSLDITDAELHNAETNMPNFI
jgi:lipoate-protein ligase A